MLGDSPGTAAADVEKAKRWAVLLVGGAAVQQVGWWSLYSELGLWCGLLGGAVVLVGARGFDCGVAGHSQDWRDRLYTAEERREVNERRRAAGKGDVPEGVGKGGGRGLFWAFLALYAGLSVWATTVSAAKCPALGTDEGWGERYGTQPSFWSCGPQSIMIGAGLSLPCLLLVLLWPVRKELVAMARAAQ